MYAVLKMMSYSLQTFSLLKKIALLFSVDLMYRVT